MNIVQVPIGDIVPYDKNPRNIPESAVKKVAASLKEFGFAQPIVVDEHNIVIVGHTRLKAAISLGMAEVPVYVANLSEAQAKAYRLTDNRTNQESSWLDDILADELKGLNDLGFDLDLTGFDDRELQRLLTDDDDMERAEETPAVPENPVTVAGDVWLMGKHRIVCGNSTNATDVAKALNGVKPHLMVTDPPYGVEYNADWRNKALRADGSPSNGRAIGTVMNDDRSDWSEAYALFPGEVAYVWHPPGAKSVEFFRTLTESGFDIRMQIIWNKSNFAIGRGDYHVKHEPCWYAVRSGKKGHWTGDRTQSTVWDIPKPNKSETGHSTQKPIECMRRPIVNNSSPGQAVYDPFSGSGTTIIAGEMTGRHIHAIELSPAYVDVAVMRWQTFSGGQAILEGDGRTFEQIKGDRLKITDEPAKAKKAA